jgi:protein-S-isoprenylcysteine O-methyltransferase Ste14
MHILLFFAHAGLVLARIRSEEQLLAARFGSDYESYRARTGELLPGTGSLGAELIDSIRSNTAAPAAGV